jgi:Ca2+/H+ antiporter
MNIYCIIIYIYVYIIYLVSQTLTDLKIIDAVLGHKLNENEDSDDSNGSVDEENKMIMAEATSCCDSLINFMERKSLATEQEIM